MYPYNSSHALTKIELNDQYAISQQPCNITYTPFNKVETITEGLNSYTIEYYPNQQKAATTLTHNNTVIEHKYYAGKAFEWETVNDKKYYYVYAEGKPIAVFIQEGDGTPVPYLILTDHLGSVDLITDRYGNVVDSMSFDAWGNRRIYNNWQQKDNTVHLIDRGFTMHQHLDSFTLINMEGRMYDPVVAQFLSPDPYVQAPDNTQGLNRYNYCYNSPLMYTDPDGEWIHLVVGAVIGGLAGGWSGYQIGKSLGATGWEMAGYIFGGSVIGSVAGLAGGAAGGAASSAVLSGGGTAMESAIVSGLASGAVTNGINAGGMTALSGGNPGDVFGATIKGTVIGGFSGMAGAATYQGMNNLLNMNINIATIGETKMTLVRPLGFLPTNTLSYMAGSTASQVTANLLNGKRPFQNVDYGLNLGLLLPLTVDGLKYSKNFGMYMANKQFPNEEIVSTYTRSTTLTPNGDLLFSQNVGIQEYYPNDMSGEFIDLSYLAGQPRPIIGRETNSMLIPNYRSYVFSIFNLRLYR
ncbi:MAG: RHS repeat-associated core domain-containing protein [Bacteroidales bacterium]